MSAEPNLSTMSPNQRNRSLSQRLSHTWHRIANFFSRPHSPRLSTRRARQQQNPFLGYNSQTPSILPWSSPAHLNLGLPADIASRDVASPRNLQDYIETSQDKATFQILKDTCKDMREDDRKLRKKLDDVIKFVVGVILFLFSINGGVGFLFTSKILTCKTKFFVVYCDRYRCNWIHSCFKYWPGEMFCTFGRIRICRQKQAYLVG